MWPWIHIFYAFYHFIISLVWCFRFPGLFLCITVTWQQQAYRYTTLFIIACSTLYLPQLDNQSNKTCQLQLQKAAKFLDTGAVRATRFLWRYPTARVSLLFYLVRPYPQYLIFDVIMTWLSRIYHLCILLRLAKWDNRILVLLISALLG